MVSAVISTYPLNMVHSAPDNLPAELLAGSEETSMDGRHSPLLMR
jgi:hypothetical protein